MGVPTRRRRPWSLAIALIAVVGVAALAVPGARRRAHLVLLYATGRIPDMAATDILRMMPPRGPYDVASLVQTRNPYATIENPHAGPADVRSGAEMFRAQCALCHGGHGGGGVGPDLTSGHFRHGASDWAIYRTILLGVPGTAMAPHPLPSRAVWQLVAYVRSAAAPTRPDSAALAPLAVHFAQLQGARLDSANWLTYSGAYDGQRHSRLAQVTAATIGRLKIKWMFQYPSTEAFFETTPIVVGGTMYVTAPPGDVTALDARTGLPRWSYTPNVPTALKLCCGRQNRGVAVEGSMVFVGTLDARLVALDAQTGAVRWEAEVADYRDGYSITGAPLAVDGRVIIGVGGGEFGIRGFLDAYDARTGTRIWRTHTVPGPGEPGHDTWAGDSWKTGGAPTWMTGTFDPGSRTLYWGTGNPGPDYNGEARLGDNLYSNSVLALDLDSGRIKWHFQFTPHDEHDWDATQVPVLADAVIAGTPRRLLLQANRNGFYYVLDRESGAFLSARAFVRQTWAAAIDSTGRPVVRPESSPTTRGTLVWPGVGGATNWWSPSYDEAAGRFFVPAIEGPGVFTRSEDPPVRGDGPFLGSLGRGSSSEPVRAVIRALRATTGELDWEYWPPPPPGALHGLGGLLSTAGGVVFGGSESMFFGLDSRTGAELLRLNLGGNIRAAPMTYFADGRQHVTVAAGRALVTFSLDGR